MDMDPRTKLDIEKTVISILENADMNDMTECKVRTLASEKMGLDLSKSVYRKLVRSIVHNFLSSRESAEDKEEGAPKKEEQDEEEEEEEEEASRRQQKQKQVQAEEEEEEEEEEEVQPAKKARKEKVTVNEDGDILICKLSSRRNVTVQNFKGKQLVSIREYYTKDGKEIPTQKGISLTLEQWEAFKKSVPAIEDAIEQQNE